MGPCFINHIGLETAYMLLIKETPSLRSVNEFRKSYASTYM